MVVGEDMALTVIDNARANTRGNGEGLIELADLRLLVCDLDNGGFDVVCDFSNCRLKPRSLLRSGRGRLRLRRRGLGEQG
jgi:hypothetical protein